MLNQLKYLTLNAEADIPVSPSQEATEERILVSGDSYEKEAQANLQAAENNISNRSEAGKEINTNLMVEIPVADLTEREWEAGVFLMLRKAIPSI